MPEWLAPSVLGQHTSADIASAKTVSENDKIIWLEHQNQLTTLLTKAKNQRICIIGADLTTLQRYALKLDTLESKKSNHRF